MATGRRTHTSESASGATPDIPRRRTRVTLKPSPILFAAEYVKDFNATQAAIRAGYSESTAKQQGSRLLTRVDVKALVAAASQQAVEIVEARTEEAIGSAAWIIERAAEVVGRALAAVPVRDSRGHIIEGEWTCNLSAATPALALLAKRFPAVFAPDGQVNIDARTLIISEGRLPTRAE